MKVVLITQVMLKPWRVCRKEVEPRKSEEWWRSKGYPKGKPLREDRASESRERSALSNDLEIK